MVLNFSIARWELGDNGKVPLKFRGVLFPSQNAVRSQMIIKGEDRIKHI